MARQPAKIWPEDSQHQADTSLLKNPWASVMMSFAQNNRFSLEQKERFTKVLAKLVLRIERETDDDGNPEPWSNIDTAMDALETMLGPVFDGAVDHLVKESVEATKEHNESILIATETILGMAALESRVRVRGSGL